MAQKKDFMKNRTEPQELKILKQLNARMELSESDKWEYLKMEKGYMGELQFDEYLRTLTSELLIINDLKLKQENKTFQIDSLIMSPEKLFLFDVKNFEGDYYLEKNILHTLSGTEVTNPIAQLERAESYLRRLLKSKGFHIPIESYLIYINPEFFLYQAPMDKRVIFLSQIDRLIEKLNKKTSRIKEEYMKLANHLISSHIVEPPYNIPKYHFDELAKGVTCPNCFSFYDDFNTHKNTIICKKCSSQEKTKAAFYRSVQEYTLLFPNEKITTDAIHKWCMLSKRSTQKLLSKNYQLVGRAKTSHYVSGDLE